MQERFDLQYTAQDGSRQRPVMVHRAIFGSIERFFGILLEQTCGELPLWLAPTQLRLLPVSSSDDEAAVLRYCQDLKLAAALRGIRVDIDTSGHRLPKLIRSAELEKLPLMAVVGKREVAAGEVALRARGAGDQGACSNLDLLNCISQATESSTDVKDIDFSSFCTKRKTND